MTPLWWCIIFADDCGVVVSGRIGSNIFINGVYTVSTRASASGRTVYECADSGVFGCMTIGAGTMVVRRPKAVIKFFKKFSYPRKMHKTTQQIKDSLRKVLGDV